MSRTESITFRMKFWSRGLDANDNVGGEQESTTQEKVGTGESGVSYHRETRPERATWEPNGSKVSNRGDRNEVVVKHITLGKRRS